MARTRLLQPGFFDDERMAETPFVGRLLFAALWTLADRDGRLEDRPEKIAAFAFPYDKPLQRKARKEAPVMLDALIAAGCVERYVVDGAACLWLPHFLDHQRPHDREAKSVLPPAPGETRLAQGAPRLAQGVKSPPVSDPVSDPVSGSGRKEAESAREAGPEPKSRRRPLSDIEPELPELIDQFPTVNVTGELAKFRDYLKAKGKTHVDYVAAFRNWLRKAEEYARARQPAGYSNGRSDPADVMEQRLAARR